MYDKSKKKKRNSNLFIHSTFHKNGIPTVNLEIDFYNKFTTNVAELNQIICR